MPFFGLKSTFLESGILTVQRRELIIEEVHIKTIYNAPNEEQGRANQDRITEKWSEKYPNAMKRWERDWDVITPIFKFSANVRTVIYTTNAIESLNATYRKLNRQRSVFPSAQALLKALYLATFEATKK